ncbi:MAG: COX15/CtaA family protein [Rubricoccaceae bacterium]
MPEPLPSIVPKRSTASPEAAMLHPRPITDGARRFVRLAWATTAYTLFVIVWGGFVRASGSGAGCGDHWPLCNGQVVPRTPAMSTLIEFGHRLTSGLLILLIGYLAYLAWRTFAKGHPARRATGFVVLFVLTEALIGAGLVLFEYVAYNASFARAYWMAAHLTNTLLLLGALTLTIWYGAGGGRLRWRRGAGTLAAALAGTTILGAGGAVTALGDTLVLGGGIDPETDPVVATLIAARIYHPTMAFVALALVAWAVLAGRRAAPAAGSLGLVVLGLYLAQMLIGAVNVWLMAPVWIQMVHLLMTDFIWMGLIFFAAQVLSCTPVTKRPAEQLSLATA